MQNSKKEADETPKSIKCTKCGFENPANLKFCGNCGTKLVIATITPKFEGLALLHITGSIYLLISLIFNALIQSSMILMIAYLVSALLGLYAGYEFHRGKVSKWLKITSALATTLGLASTFIIFMIGIGIGGVIGPAWIIFLINAMILWKEKARL